MSLVKDEIVQTACDCYNLSDSFAEISRALKKSKNNPMWEDASFISRALHRIGHKIDKLTERLEEEGLFK
ncbi:hypothetical protein MUP77_12415 [Candidatus Bathyarchaeota archaeon]|nr:hypothetical protein [Candidatus Bathyarchaeota archaeon]